MALQRDTLYPGRFDTGDSLHPQGAFRNRTTPTAQDGSYLEEQWLNDWDGFFASLLHAAGLSPDGNVDAVGASQYFAALQTMTRGNYVTAGGTANVITLADTSVTAYTDGMSLRFKVSLANTGATTLNVNGVGAQTVYGSAGLACQGGELTPGYATVVYSSALSGFVIVHCTGAKKQVSDATQSHHALSKGQYDTDTTYMERITRTSAYTLSGTAYNITSGVPSWAKKAKLLFKDLVTSAASPVLIQIGGATLLTSGYVSASVGANYNVTGSTSGTGLITSGFAIRNSSAAGLISGVVDICLSGAAAIACGRVLDTGAVNISLVDGNIAFAGALQKITITTVSGTATMSGSLTIIYEG